MNDFTHKPNAASAVQFDGTIDKLVEIIGATVNADDAQVQVVTNMIGTGIDNASINGPGVNVQFRAGEWIVIPADATKVPFIATDADFQSDWGL